MRTNRNKGKGFLTGFVALAILLCMAWPTLAADSGAMDLTQSGYISLTLLDSAQNTPVPGAELTLYKIANISASGNQLKYVPRAEFTDCGLTFEDLSQYGMASHLVAYADEKDVSCILTDTTNAKGQVTFSNLTTGLYLVRQTNLTDGYYTMLPFLVSLPMSVDGVWVYDIDASPKAEVNTGTATTQLTAHKVWAGDNTSIPTQVTAALLRDGVSYQTVVLNAANDWTYTWRDLDAHHTWDIAELDVNDKYTVTYAISGNVVTITNTSKSTSTTNTPTPTDSSQSKSGGPSTPKLIQTGQLNWPIPVLAGLGILLLAIGRILASQRKNKHD